MNQSVKKSAIRKTDREIFASQVSLLLVFVTSVILYGLLQFMISPQYFASFVPRGADDAMRMLAARDLLEGQSWFDTRQYRVLPPEGLELHWSRFIDAAIAGLLWFFRLFASQSMAERLAAAAWPAILFVTYLIVCARAAHAARGNSAASFAMFGVATLPVLSVAFFALGRVDHHNVQLICMAFICGGLLSQGDARKVGMAAGAVAGFSLGVGLETIVFTVLAGLILVIEFCRNHVASHDRLLGFGLGLAASATAIFYLQTQPGTWGALRCDTLGIPMLLLPVGAGIYAFLLTLFGRQMSATSSRFLVAILLAAIWIALIWAPLLACAEGPYANVPADIRAMVIDGIAENRSMAEIWRSNPVQAFGQFAPFFTLAMLLLPSCLRKGSRAERIVLAFLVLGLCGALLQLRLLIWGVAVLPIAFGLVAANLANTRWPRLRLLKPFVVIPLLVFVVFPQLFVAAARSMVLDEPVPAPRMGLQDAQCNTVRNLEALNTVPSALLMTTLNLGAPVLFSTHHSVTSVPYHRSPKALITGVAPFNGDLSGLIGEAETLGASYVLVCRNQTYGTPESIGSRLSAGKKLDDLEDIALESEVLRLLRIK